ncbi:MAG TPA: membrane protein insertase YidC [Mycobacteriales bacterium]|nr:membrane protein insertase YidC [Mycobacteriales bacterium]
MGFLDPLYHAVAWLLVQIHSVVAHIVGESAGWLLAVVLLTVLMRLAIYPFFVKQIRNQRKMQEFQPKIKELQAKYKNDKEKLQLEMMALWREEGMNPVAGCLPMLLQMPVFLSLFHTLREIKPITLVDKQGHAINAAASKCLELASSRGVSPTKLICDYPSNIAGFPQKDLFSAAHAKLFGIAPMPASFKTSHSVLTALGGHQASTRVLCLILVVVMIATTFITSRQMMARNGPMEGQAAQTQKIMMYIFPLSFLIYGWFFPIGVLIYWVISNLWQAGQWNLVVRRLDAAIAAKPVVKPSGPPPGAKPKLPPRGPAPKPGAASAPLPDPASGSDQPAAKPSRSTANIVLPPGGAIGPTLGGAPRPAPPAQRPSPNRSKKKRKGRR